MPWNLTKIAIKHTIYTDGSCLGNPGPGGWGFLILDEEKIIYKNSGAEKQTTNNRMEMQALIEALKYYNVKVKDGGVLIKSDSNLIVQTINQGWKKKANTDLWLLIDQELEKTPFKIEWVKAHAHDEYNNLVDEMAQSEAQQISKRNLK